MDVVRRFFPRSLIRALLVAALVILQSVSAVGDTANDDELRGLLPAVPPVLTGLEEVLFTAPELCGTHNTRSHRSHLGACVDQRQGALPIRAGYWREPPCDHAAGGQ